MGCSSSQPEASHAPQERSRPAPTGVLLSKLDRNAFPQWQPSTPLSQAEIDAMRNEYWHTRVTGAAEIWTTLRAAAEAVLNDDIELANAILEANVVQMDGGSLSLCYDERGNQYAVPEYCFVQPKAVAASSSKAGQSTSASQSGGKEIQVKIRLYPGEKNFTLTISDGLLVSNLKQAIADEATAQGGITVEVSAANQRLLYMGRELKDNQVIAVASIEPDKIVQAYVRPAQR